jgi:ATP-dependent RNA helicase RhlE
LTQFTDFGLAEPILRALAAEGYTTPTPIQQQAIPTVMTGRDLIGIAQTGTGKTAAFALPILQHLLKNARPTPRKSCRTLVLSPTRELASQIGESFRTYGQFLRLSHAVVFGGVSLGKQIQSLASGVDVVVATPGRLLDLINQRAFSLEGVEIFVLDEADQMLDMGFIHDIRKLVAILPKQRQTLFFSATMAKEIGELADRLLKDPAKVSVTPVATTAERVDQHVIFIETGKKQALLHKLLEGADIARALVFTRTKHGANKVAQRLCDAGHPANAIHGNKSQVQRERALAEFKSGKARLLIATDIAARGIDVDGVTHVINFDLPNVPESYVHRIGRTARAGAAGVAISFCDGEERAFLRDIERTTRQKVPVMESPLGPNDSYVPTPVAREVDPRAAQHRPGGGRNARPQQRQGGPRPDQRGERASQPKAQNQGEPRRWTSGSSDPTGERASRPNNNRSHGRFGR